MEKNKLREVPRFKNIKEIIYNSVKLYPNNIAFKIKTKKDEKEVEYKEWYYETAIKEGTEKNILAKMIDNPTFENDKIPKNKPKRR